MSYLWDRSGPPDPEIERLERTLASLRPKTVAPSPPARRRPWALAATAALAVAAAATVVAWPRPPRERVPPAVFTASGWELSIVAGRPEIDGSPVTEAVRLAPDRELHTDPQSAARLAVPSIGMVDVDGGTRLKLMPGPGGAHRIRLAVGKIHVMIWSPPGTFFVDTPAGTAVDLGCAYTVAVGADGDGVLTVHSGWVGFEQAGHESLVPAGAECALRRGRGPGTPRLGDAPTRLGEALGRFDAPGEPEERERALHTVLSTARAQDAFTLWHLLGRVSGTERRTVLDRLVALVPATRTVDRKAVLAGDPGSIDELWGRLDLGPISLWRRWKARAE
jgi:hypothetical protein